MLAKAEELLALLKDEDKDADAIDTRRTQLDSDFVHLWLDMNKEVARRRSSNSEIAQG